MVFICVPIFLPREVNMKKRRKRRGQPKPAPSQAPAPAVTPSVDEQALRAKIMAELLAEIKATNASSEPTEKAKPATSERSRFYMTKVDGVLGKGKIIRGHEVNGSVDIDTLEENGIDINYLIDTGIITEE